MASTGKDASLEFQVCDGAVRPESVLDGVDCSLAEARGIGNEAYTDNAFLALERQRLLSPTWTCIGIGSDLPEPGDVKPVDLVGLPLLMVRAENGELRVFHNVCSHRGVRLVEESGQVKRVIVCPYHSGPTIWTARSFLPRTSVGRGNTIAKVLTRPGTPCAACARRPGLT